MMRLFSSSPRLFSGPAPFLAFCTGMLGGVWERSYISFARLPQQLREQHSTPCFLFFLGLLSLCSFCSAVSTARPRCTVTFDSTFLSFQTPPLFAKSFTGHFENMIVPYQRPLKLHFENFHMNYPLYSL